MASLWERIQALEGQSLATPTGKGFDITSVTQQAVAIKLHEKGKDRTIPKEEFTKLEEAGFARADLRPNQLRKAAIAEFNPAVIATIIRKALEPA